MTKHISENELTLLIKQLNLDELDVGSKTEEVCGNIHKESANGMTEKQDGWIQVKDQRIIVHDPVEGGKRPVISSAAPVKLKVNDIEVVSEATVFSSDRIHWEIEEKALFDIKVSEDKLYAYFNLHSKSRYAWRLIDTDPMLKLSITAIEDKEIVLETVHLSEVVTQLERMSIQSHLEIASLLQELINPTHKPIVAVKGKPVIPVKHAQLEIYFSEQVEKQFFEVSGSIDFRNHLQIPSVKSGDLIAKKIPAEAGTPGYDVFGGVIMPAPPKDIIIIAKSSVELTPDGEIIARKEGRPRITGGKIKTFDISTSYVVSGDVNIETGNIVFFGDVIVYGNVTDYMIIESLGNVYVYGSVFNATITATGSVFVRGNVIASKIYSGYFGVMYNRLYNTSKVLSEQIEKLLVASKMLIQALESRKQTVRFGQIVLLLMETKIKDTPSVVKELLLVLSNIQHIKKEEYQKLKEMSEFFIHPTKLLDAATDSFLQSFLALLKETNQEVARMQEEKVEIRLNQCHNSELKSNGDILILREGVLLSDLYSAGNIIFYHDSAVCRGSLLKAEGSITAKIIGGQTGAITVLKAKSQVEVRKMYTGRVCVGRYCTDIFEAVENMTFNSCNMKQRA